MLYDDACPMCTFQMKTITWLDWFGTCRFVPVSSPTSQAAAPKLSREDLMAAMHCIASDGRIYRGARAIRFLGMRIPLLIPLALVLWIPGIIQIAEIIYQWISRHRYQLSRIFGCAGACSLLPERKGAATIETAGPNLDVRDRK